jgi:hypothetical protein
MVSLGSKGEDFGAPGSTLVWYYDPGITLFSKFVLFV